MVQKAGLTALVIAGLVYPVVWPLGYTQQATAVMLGLFTVGALVVEVASLPCRKLVPVRIRK